MADRPIPPPELAAAAAESRLRAAGISLTLGGEPTYVPIDPEGAEWSVAADGPSKLGYARALAAWLQQHTWPGSTLLYCPGKRYEGELNPRWVLRLISGIDATPLVHWPQDWADPGGTAAALRPLPASSALGFLAAIGRGLGLSLQPLALRDPLDPQRHVWALPLCHHDTDNERDDGSPAGWQAAAWPLAEERRELLAAQGPAGLRLPLQHFPEGVLQQVLTLEIDEPAAAGWSLFLPPLARAPLEQLLAVVAAASAPWSKPELSGVLPLDCNGAWRVLGLTADPGVLEVNLPVCDSWSAYCCWLETLATAGEAVGLRSWKRSEDGSRSDGRQSTGGGNHLLWGGPSLEANPFFSRPAWLVGLLRFWQHHPSLSYLFSGDSVGPASQAPRPDEGSASLLDLELAHSALEQLPPGDQRLMISETLRHLHADRSGNTHRSEISLDKLWNPAWPGGCQGLIEFRAMETLPEVGWSKAVALLWSALAAHLLEPSQRPRQLRAWGEELHDRCLLPSALWADLEAVLALLAADGLALDQGPYRAIWQWRFPLLLHWTAPEANPAAAAVSLEIRRALEPWPLLCDTPREGGYTSRFIDSSLRRIELVASAELQRRHTLWLNGRPLPLEPNPGSNPNPSMAVRYRASSLYPCLHPTIASQLPLELVLRRRSDQKPIQAWSLQEGAASFEATSAADCASTTASTTSSTTIKAHQSSPWRSARPGEVTIDLRLPPPLR
ncbi:MAG: transglutaminase family protein [Prochlorococcaceae cyanobacterium]